MCFGEKNDQILAPVSLASIVLFFAFIEGHQKETQSIEQVQRAALRRGSWCEGVLAHNLISESATETKDLHFSHIREDH